MTILELLEAHHYRSADFMDTDNRCSCGHRYGNNIEVFLHPREMHHAHVAEVIETHTREKEARAWSNGFHKGRKADRHIRTWPRNPYRTDQTREAHDGR